MFGSDYHTIITDKIIIKVYFLLITKVGPYAVFNPDRVADSG